MDFYSKVTVVMGFAALLAAAYALYWARRANNELRALLREMEPSIDVAWRKAEEDYLRIDDGRLNAILRQQEDVRKELSRSSLKTPLTPDELRQLGLWRGAGPDRPEGTEPRP